METNLPSSQSNIKSVVDKLTPTELLRKYLSYFPLFIIALLISVAVGFLYILYVQPIYKVSTRVFVRSNSDKKLEGSSKGSSDGDLIESAMSSGKQVNLDNEIVMITARPLVQKVIQDHHFNYYYFRESSFKNIEIYKDCPFEVMEAHWADTTVSTKFNVSDLNLMGGIIRSGKSDKVNINFKWDKLIYLQGNKFKMVLRNPDLMTTQAGHLNSSKEAVYCFINKPISSTVDEIATNLMASSYSAKTTIITLDLKGANSNKSADILNAIVQEYNNQAIEDNSTIINKTTQFINQRLNFITKELGVVETGLKDFKNTNQVIDLPTQSGQVLTEKASLEQEFNKLGIHEKLFQLLNQQIRQMPADHMQIIPTNLDIDGANQKFAAFELYNTLVLKKQREEPLLGKKSPVLSDLNLQLENAYNGVLQTLTEQEHSLNVQKALLSVRMKKYEGMVGEVPANEKTLVEIKRQQNVKEGLYLYLLQKREESAISNSSSLSNYQQLEPAGGSGLPLEPNKERIYLFSVMMGLVIPFISIFSIDLFDDKIKNRADISSRTTIPIIADIGHISHLSQNLVVADKSRNIAAEQFRILRTNLHFLLKDKSNIMVTSTESDEGKTFIALNLAAVLSITGKKVALLEFDLRKPGILYNLGLEEKKMGLSDFLAKQTDDLEGMLYTLENYSSLHIYGSGTIPPNPSELMMGERIKELFQQLKDQYDYIIIDTPPVGVVSDAMNLMDYVDTTLYVVRQNKTLKKQVSFINDLFINKQLKNVGLLINDIRKGARYGYYGHYYGYGKNNKTYDSYFDKDKRTKSLSKIFGKEKENGMVA